MDVTTDLIRAIRRALLSWYARDRDRLPWREEPTPWRVLVSELMLQQTTVKAVIPYFERFLGRFPEPASLAAASEEDVLALWSGLGYYRRARSLHEAARRITEEHGGAVPADAALLRELPGVGAYTTAAVGSIAFGLPLAVVDGNVVRVVARLFALPGRRGETVLEARVRKLADVLLAREAPGDFNQALMELGRRVCSPRSPACLVCPLSKPCVSRREGRPERRPGPPTRKRPVDVVHVAALVRRRSWLLLTRRPDGGRMAGLLELPTVAVDGAPDAVGALARGLAAMDLPAEVGDRLATVHHTIVGERITQHLHRAELRRPRRRRASDSWRFVRPGDLAALPLTAATAKTLSAAGIAVRPGGGRG